MLNPGQVLAAPTAARRRPSIASLLGSAALLCLALVLLWFFWFDFNQPSKPYYGALELYIAPVGLIASGFMLARNGVLRLELMAGAIGAWLATGYAFMSQVFGFLFYPEYRRADALAWSLLLLVLIAFGLAWWESRSSWRDVLGSAALGVLVGGVVASLVIWMLIITNVLVHSITF